MSYPGGDTDKFTLQKRKLTALVLNLTPAALKIHSVLFLYAFDGTYWRQHFLHYTDYSDFRLLISSIGLSTALVLELCGRRERTPCSFRLFRFMTVSSEGAAGPCSRTPPRALRPVFERGRNILRRRELHPLNTLSVPAIVSFLFCGSCRDFGRRKALPALMPTALYHTVMLCHNAGALSRGRTGISCGPGGERASLHLPVCTHTPLCVRSL